MGLLSAIFEEADLKSKASTSVASGDWQGWTASELDDLIKVPEEADALIGKIIRTGREFPDGLWEALKRKYGREELSGSIGIYLIDEERGKINLHQSYIDRLVDQDLRNVIQKAGRLVRPGQPPVRYTGSRSEGNFQEIPWDSSEIEKAKTFIDAVQATKRKKAALKGLETKKVNKENETKEGGQGLKPIQTEHWHRWMPDEVPTEDTPWEKLRPRLKTTSKLDMDIMVRDMEKAGVVTPNEHGNKVFRAAKYQEIMSQPRERFAHSHIKNFSGTHLANAQFIRGNDSDPALVSVGLPLPVEKRWKTEHPKLYAYLKELRNKKERNHSAVMQGIRPIGWVRIDKLDAENWMIEELQQDIDNIEQDGYARRFGHDITGTWEQQHKRRAKDIDRMEKRLGLLNKHAETGNQWISMVEKWKPQWQAWGNDMPKGHDPVLVLFSDYGTNIHNSKNEEIPGHKEWSSLFLQCQKSIKETTGWNNSKINWMMDEPEDLKNQWLKNEINEEKVKLEEELQGTKAGASELKRKADAKHPETPGALAWKKDIDAMREVIDKFPRWAMHAVKQAAKENGVKNLWWLTYKQKLINANPPRSFTSDKLAKQFGFHKVSLDAIDPKIRGSYGMQGITARIEWSANHASANGEDNSDVDQFLWMAPVDQVMTEQTKPLDIGVFG
jgi:hypothetical protein